MSYLDAEDPGVPAASFFTGGDVVGHAYGRV